MKIHYNNLTYSDLHKAASKAGVTIERDDFAGSKTHKGKVDIILSGDSSYNVNFSSEAYKAATYDQWGIFLNELFTIDPTIKAGDAYVNVEHFHWSTGNRYASEFETHKTHKWEYQGITVGNGYNVHHCTKCSAIRRFANKDYIKENFLDRVGV